MNALRDSFTQLLADLQLIKDRGFAIEVETEACFRLAEKYLNDIVLQLRDQHFSNQAEEVEVYKEILPAFVAEREYYKLVNYANRFCPDHKKDQPGFWNDQVKRLQRFIKKYPQFYDYYKAGTTAMDTTLYTRSPENSYTELTGMLLARERYAVFAKTRLGEGH